LRQVVQNVKTGETVLTETPIPASIPGHLLLRTTASLISAGTERMILDVSKGNLLQKAKAQPDKVKQVLTKLKTDGFLPTLEAVKSKLEQLLPLGYCHVGRVAETGVQTTGFAVGDRVVSNGGHAEWVSVPQNLCARIPDEVSDEEAVFTVLGAVGLEGLRLAKPELGETFAVIGLGLIGQLVVQLLQAHGCRVLGIDFNERKCQLARAVGAQVINLSAGSNIVDAAMGITDGRGVDGVIITAATSSNEPVNLSARMCRQRGRIVLVGVTGLKLSRADFYRKEISFQVSCSYGPGRYDTGYEAKGFDYPFGLVRWTAQRNFESVLTMMAAQRLHVKPLITHRFAFADALDAYRILQSDQPYIGLLLQYPLELKEKQLVVRRQPVLLQARGNDSSSQQDATRAVVGMIGAGNYASRVLLPALSKTHARLKTIVTQQGDHAVHTGRKSGFEKASTDVRLLLEDPEINTVFIVTRHDSHGRLVLDALRFGKNVFVEKPLCLTGVELDEISHLMHLDEHKKSRLMVGFNRRFSPHIRLLHRKLVEMPLPKVFVYTVNAGQIPEDHWTQDPEIGGGRVIGEACHFIDLLRYLAGSPIEGAEAYYLKNNRLRDIVTLQLSFSDGSIGTVHYLSNGHSSFAKERLEVFCSSQVFQLDNFKKLTSFGGRKIPGASSWKQNKGQDDCVNAFIKAVENEGPSPIPLDEVFEVMRVTLNLSRQ